LGEVGERASEDVWLDIRLLSAGGYGESQSGRRLHLSLPSLSRQERPHLVEAERPQHHDQTEHDVPDRHDRVLRDREGTDCTARRVTSQGRDIERLRLPDAARSAKSPDNMCEDAIRNTVNAVIGMPNAAMKTMLTPIRHAYEPAEGNATRTA
jgi:hypothetical protein